VYSPGSEYCGPYLPISLSLILRQNCHTTAVAPDWIARGDECHDYGSVYKGLHIRELGGIPVGQLLYPTNGETLSSLPCPLPRRGLISWSVVLVGLKISCSSGFPRNTTYMRDLRDEGIVGVGISQHRTDRQQD
jgi:hypothetical protein